MKYQILFPAFILFLSFLFSCNPTEEKKEKIISTAEKTIEKNEELKQEIGSKVEKPEKLFHFYAIEAGFGLNFLMGDSTEPDRGIPFEIETEKTKDSLRISFSFSALDCQQFKGYVNTKGNSVYLTWESTSTEACDHDVVYRHRFSLLREVYPDPIIYLNGKLVK